MAYREPPHQDDDWDELMRKADQLLDDDAPGAPDEDVPPAPWEDLHFYANYGNRYGQDVRNYQNNYGHPEEPRGPGPETEPGPAIPAYNADFQDPGPFPRPPQKPAGAIPGGRCPPPPGASQTGQAAETQKKAPWSEAFAGHSSGSAGSGSRRVSVDPQLHPNARNHAAHWRPERGAATVLLCGTDQEGTRTDTMMLLYLNAQEQAVTLVSLPRDTLTHTASGNDAKLNSAYGRNNGGEEGMEALLDYVADIIGYRPDGYMLITLDAFVDIVDLMGGVEFDVPMDMFYEDSSQDLFIDLKEGKQTLDGYAAMGLVRFRKGYYDQDLGRVDVQRQFLSACMDQWLTLPNLVKLPQILSTMHASSESSLTTGNLLWIAYTAWRSGLGNLQTETLPGYADMLDGVSYYILDPEGVADVINRCCNPYTREIDASDLNIVY